MPALRVFEIGDRYGKLTVIQRRDAAVRVMVRCDCGTEKDVNAGDLVYRIRSCGRCTRWAGVDRSKMAHPLYAAYKGMVARCHLPNHPRYPEYGARGITVCERWREDFWAFVADVGERPVGRTLDRVDNDGNYEPGNVRWATPVQQANNRRPRRVIYRPRELTAAIARVEALCAGWDQLSKGESPTTAQIRAALRGVA